VNRTFVSFPITDFFYCKKQLLHWANRFIVCCFLDNNQYSLGYHSYECLVGAGAQKYISAEAGAAFTRLSAFCDDEHDWLFGHFSYDLKNELEQLDSGHYDGVGFPDLFFFIPEVVVLLNGTEISIGTAPGKHHSIFKQLFESTPSLSNGNPGNFSSRFTKEEYINSILLLKHHILRGDCYEVNFCQEFYSESHYIDPLQVYFSLSSISPNPFAAYYKVHDKFLCCASPERYLKKSGENIISQPIKGTWSRDLKDAGKDLQYRDELFNSSKERAENVMVVDLVRNDLSKICVEGSVQVSELYGIYSFPQVHQMVSTITGRVRNDIHWVDAIKATFPMGSMTGAPKKRVMELIERYEKTKRGIFSGAIGYVSPQQDFDFNVVIRSILYNQKAKYLSYQVGSGITFYSDPQKEYEECMLKAAAIIKALT